MVNNDSNIDMEELIKTAKEQQAQQTQTKLAAQKTRKMVSVTPVNQSNEHGSYVQTSDGTGAIVIDNDYELNKMRENDITGKALSALVNSSTIISDANAYKPDYGPDAPEGYDPGVEYMKNNPYDKKSMEMQKIKKEFAELTYGPNGLVNANGPEGKLVSEALDKLRTGEIVLPTPEEYKQQKEALKDKQRTVTVSKKEPTPKVEPEIKQEETAEPKMPDAPENAIIKKGVLEQLNEINNVRGNETVQPVHTPVMEPTPKVEEPKVEQPTKQPINLAEAELKFNNNVQPVETTQTQEAEQPPVDVTVINVPEGQVSDFMKTMPVETFNKVVTSSTIQVNEVQLKDIPTASRKISSIAEYRKLSERRHVKSAELTERVLVNSGIIVTLKAATSLEMATIFKSPTSKQIDWYKAYQFCFEHTVNTSIGKLSFNDFIIKVSPSDIETILGGIYEISETDERNISITCGEGDGGCGTRYDVKVKIADLPDIDKVDEKTKNRIAEIINVRNNISAAKDLQMNSPTMFVKYIELGDRVLAIRNTTGNIMIERMDSIDEVTQVYGPLIAVLILYVENITVIIREREDVEPSTFLIDDLRILCEELLQSSDDEIKIIKDIITKDLDNDYIPVSYSIKGPIVCPNCGKSHERLDCTMSDLVFQKAQSVLV